MLCEVALDADGEVLDQFVAFPDGVEQEGAAVAEAAGDVIHVQVSLHVACHEIGGVDQIGAADGVVAETQVRAGETARLLGVVREVCLAVFVGVVADNLNRVLVCAYGAVGAEAVELGLEGSGVAESHLLGQGQRGEGDVVYDADGEVVAGFGKGQVFVYADNLAGGGVLRRQAVAAADDEGSVLAAVEGVADVEVEGLAVGAGLLGAVKDGDAFYGGGDGGKQMPGAEGTIEVYRNQTDFLALGGEVVDSFLGGLCHRAHGDDDALGVGSAVVVEQVVLAAGDFADGGHVAFDNLGHGLVVFVGGFAVLEEDVGVLGSTAGDWLVGVEGAVAEVGQGVLVKEGGESVAVDFLNLLNLMRGAETVKEVDEGDAALDGGEVGDTGQIHYLLYRTFGEHGEAGLTARHDVLVVAEDAEGVAGEGAGRDVENAWQQLAGNLVHIWNHQQQALRGSVGGGEGTGLERAVNSTGGAALALHFLHEDCLAEHVLAACGRPFIDILRHRRRRGDGIDGCYFRKHIAHMRCGLVAVAGEEFFRFIHNVLKENSCVIVLWLLCQT